LRKNVSDDRELVSNLFKECSVDTQRVAVEIIRLERQKLHMRNPIGIVEDIVGVIKAIIK